VGGQKRGPKPKYEWTPEMLDSLAIIWASAPKLDREQIRAGWAAINERTLDDDELTWAEHRLGSRKKLQERLAAEGKLNADLSRNMAGDQSNADQQVNDKKQKNGSDAV
jgi:hypothetical protein